jgi:hypothetical protein
VAFAEIMTFHVIVPPPTDASFHMNALEAARHTPRVAEYWPDAIEHTDFGMARRLRSPIVIGSAPSMGSTCIKIEKYSTHVVAQPQLRRANDQFKVGTMALTVAENGCSGH